MTRPKIARGMAYLIAALVLPVCPGVLQPAHAQGSRKDDIVFNSRGIPLAGASVHVCSMPATGQPCSPSAAIYSDPALTQALANPTTTDGMGNYFFYAAPGQYEIEISGPGITTKQIPNVVLPSDPSSPTFSSVSTTGGISAFTLNLSGNLTVNGSTAVIGNMASGTLTLTNQSTPPGTASAGTVNLYTKTTDKRLYYKDETGTEIGPIASASGAQTNVANTWTAPQYINADFHTKGPNPTWDVTQFGGYIGPNFATSTTGTMAGSSHSLNVASAMDFAVGNGILVVGAGPAPVIPTPQAPSISPFTQQGSTGYSYCVVDTDWFGGRTPCSAAGTTSTGPAAFGLQSYAISGWSTTSGVVTVTTAAHNIPTTAYNGFLWPQVEIQSGSTNSPYCEGAFTLTSVPSSTSVRFTRYGLADATMNACSGGTMRVLPRVALTWDSHYSASATNATCSGSTATLTINPGIFGPNGTWIIPYGVKAVVAGVSDTHYNGTFNIGGWTGANTTVSYPIGGGTCSGVATGNLGGTVSYVPGKAVKNHLIYRCTGGSCALPANAGNYALVGVAQGNDGYFVDDGFTITASRVDLSDVPATAPTSAENEYLDTTITNISGTTFTLAAASTNAVTGNLVWHDNTPNLLAVCAAMPVSGTQGNGGHVIIPTPATAVSGPGGSFFPIMGNFDTGGNGYLTSVRNCQPNTTFDFRSQVWMQGTMLFARSVNVTSDQGSAQCSTANNSSGSGLQCIGGYAYPLFYFEPEEASNNYFANISLTPNQPYQAGMFYDQQLNGDGAVNERYDNVHLNGGSGAIPIIDKGGFGRYWNYGGWSSTGSNFAIQRSYLFTQNCGAPAYQQLGSQLSTYIIETRGTYNYGTAEINGCGLSPGFFQNANFTTMLGEGTYGPGWLFNTSPYGMTSVNFTNASYSDPVGGLATPFFDLTNTTTTGLRVKDTQCASGYQQLLETTTTAAFYSGVQIDLSGGEFCFIIGAQNYKFANLPNNMDVDSSYNTELLGTSQVFSPMSQPAALQSATQGGAGNIPPGTYQYCLTASDAFGGETAYTANACTSVTITGSNSIVNMQMPASFPAGAAGLNLYVNNSLANANVCNKPQYTTAGGSYTYNSSFQCGGSPPTTTTAAATVVNSQAVGGPKISFSGELASASPRPEQNIFLPGALTSTWTGLTWVPDKAITVTRVQVQAKTAPAGCSTNAIVRLTDGTSPVNVTVSAAANDSGAISQNYAAGSTMTVAVQTAAAGCSTSPADANVAIQYKMQ